MKDLIKLMDEVSWNPFSVDKVAKEDFLDWMSTPYQMNSVANEQERISDDLADMIDFSCIDPNAKLKTFEYYAKLDSFYKYRRDNGMEVEATYDIIPLDIPEDCSTDEKVIPEMFKYYSHIIDHMEEELEYENRSYMLEELSDYISLQ
jgi:hypothetical protein